MKYLREYHGTIWTNHALSRLEQRGIKQGDAYAAFRRPDRSRYSQSRGGWVYERSWGQSHIKVVAKQNDRQEWVILSVWQKNIRKTTSPSNSTSIWSRLLKWLTLR